MSCHSKHSLSPFRLWQLSLLISFHNVIKPMFWHFFLIKSKCSYFSWKLNKKNQLTFFVESRSITRYTFVGHRINWKQCKLIHTYQLHYTHENPCRKVWFMIIIIKIIYKICTCIKIYTFPYFIHFGLKKNSVSYILLENKFMLK